MPYSLATLWLQTGQPLISDASVKLITDAGTTMALIFLMGLGLWVLIRPAVAALSKRDHATDGVTQAFIDESRAAREDAREAREDNRKLIKVIEDGREDDRKLAESVQGLSASIQQSTSTTLKLIDVAMGHIQTTQQNALQLPDVLQQQHNRSVEEVKKAMSQAFEIRDETLKKILSTLEELKRESGETRVKVDEVLTLLHTARPVERPDTGPLANRPTTGSDDPARTTSEHPPVTSTDLPQAGPDKPMTP